MAELQLKYGEKHSTVIQLKDSIEKMAENLGGRIVADNIEAIGPASVKIIEQAMVPGRPAGYSNLSVTAIAFFMAVFLGFMLVFIFEYLDQTFKSPQDIESFLNLPYLGSVPQKTAAGSYGNLAEQLFLIMKDRGIKSVLLMAVYNKEGVTAATVNLAQHLAKITGSKVLVIDANLRRPSIHKIFKAGDTAGISDVLGGKIEFEKAVKDLGSNRNILFAGRTALNPITLLNAHAMQEVMNAAEDKYDIILLDCANLNDFRDGFLLSSMVDGVVLVVNEGKTRKQAVQNAILPLQQTKANILGVILNNRTFVIPSVIYDKI